MPEPELVLVPQPASQEPELVLAPYWRVRARLFQWVRGARLTRDDATGAIHECRHTEVRARDVGELAAELCGPLFAKTTGAQIPVDGGNERVI